MRQSVVADAVLDAEAVAHVPVVLREHGNRLVDIVTNVLFLQLRVAGAEAEQEVEHGIACQTIGVGLEGGLVPAIVEIKVAMGVAEELLVLGVAVVAASELHGMPAV